MTWEEMKAKYPENRDAMTEEKERAFVADCFSCYEAEDFSKIFWTPFEQHKDLEGQKFEVIARATTEDCDLCTLPRWTIRFEDGIIIDAYPEEIIPSEMRANGCTLKDIEQR